MSIRINNSTVSFNHNVSFQEALEKADSIIAAISMFRNPFDYMSIHVNQNGTWSVA